MPPPNADTGYVITYTVVQRTTDKNVRRVRKMFERELQLTQGRMTSVVDTQVREVDQEEARSWNAPERPEVKVV
jgi:hypothetical protein